MRKMAAALLLVLVAAAVLAGSATASLKKAEATTAAVIQDAYGRGELSYDQMILQKAYSVYAPWKVRDDLRGGATEKCGLPAVREIDEALPSLPDPVADEIRDLRARPSNSTYIETTHFRIHYDTGGSKKILNWPDATYRDAIATAAENCWTEEVTTMGFLAPPPDGSDGDGGGGNDLYDIYVQNLGTGLYGYCQPTYYSSEPGYPPNAATSYIVIDNDYAGFSIPAIDAMKVTVAHEFNHACQAAHDVAEELWYMEATSTWIEDQIYDGINDYRQYLSSFMTSLFRSVDFDDGSIRIYGSCVWNFFLDEYVGGNIVANNWDQLETTTGTAMQGIDTVLGTYGMTIEETYAAFAVWCYFTGTRDDGAHFEEGAYWPQMSIMRSHNTYPTVFSGPVAGQEPDAYGCNYIQFNNPGGGQTGLRVSYDGPQLLSVANYAFLNYRTSGGVYGEYGEIPLNSWGIGDLTVEGWDGMSSVVLVVANGQSGVSDMDYDYDAEQVDTGVVDPVHAFGLEPASPNPFSESTQIVYSVPAGGGHVDVVIYDVNGREVRHLVSDRIEAGPGVAVWDGLDDRGRHVASGVYFARLDIDGVTASGKLMVLR